jgi:hypothetical protein
VDYHLEFDRHYYSVPHALVGEEVELRVTRTTVLAPLQAASSAWRIAMAKSWAQGAVDRG